MAGLKISEGMVDAGEAALKACAVEYALKECKPVPDFDEMSPRELEHGRILIRAILRAGADHFAKHGN